MSRTVQAYNTDFLFILDLSQSIHLLLASVHNLFKEITVLCIKVLLFHPLNILPKLYRLLENFGIPLDIVKALCNLHFVATNLVIKFWVNIDDALDLNVLVSFFCLDIALPELLELLQMQILEMFLTHLRQRTIDNLLHLLLKLLPFWGKFHSIFLRIVANCRIDPGHASETLLILLVKLIYLLN